MIKLDDEFSLKPNTCGGWEIHQIVPTTSWNAKTETTNKVTYHANLTQCFDYILERNESASKSVSELKSSLDRAKGWVEEFALKVDGRARQAILETERFRKERQ